MTDLQAFEIRLASALDAYANDVDGRVDAVDVTARASLARRRPWDRLRLPIPIGVPRLAPAVVLVVVLALLAGLVWVGASLLAPHRLLGLAPTGVELVAVDGWSPGSAVAGTDGSVWLSQAGRLERVDPNGTVTTWDVGDDLRFAGSIASARAGGVWLIGRAGIQRFDGTGFDATIATPSGVWVGRVAEGRDGSLWITGGGQGLFRRDGDAWTAVALPNPGLTGGAIAIDDRGRAWVSLVKAEDFTAMGVARLDGSTWTTFGVSDAGPLTGMVDSIVQASDGAIWVSTTDGIAVMRSGSWAASGPNELRGDRPSHLAIGPDGTVWAGAGGGSVRVGAYRDGAWDVYWPPVSLLAGDDSADVYVMPTSVGVSAAWFAFSGRGLLRFADERWTTVGGLDARPVVSGIERLVGGAGSDAWGLGGRGDSGGCDQGPAGGLGFSCPRPPLHLQPSAVEQEQLVPGGGTSRVRDLALAPDGTPWAATNVGLAARIHGAWTIVDRTPATAVTVAPDGRVWAASSDRVWSLTPTSQGWTVSDVVSLPINYEYNGVGALAVDGRGTLWAAPGLNGWGVAPGLYRLLGSVWERVDIVPGVETVTLDLETAPNGDLWATIDGYREGDGEGDSACCIPSGKALVARFDVLGWTTYGAAQGIPVPGVYGPGLAIAADGTVWLASDGLISFDGATWTRHLAWLSVRAVAVSADGTIWASSWTYEPTGFIRVPPGSPALQGR